MYTLWLLSLLISVVLLPTSSLPGWMIWWWMWQKSERKEQWLLHTDENVLLWLGPGSSYKSMSCAVFKANIFLPIIELNNCPKQIDAWGREESKGNLRGCSCRLAVFHLNFTHHLPPPNLHVYASTVFQKGVRICLMHVDETAASCTVVCSWFSFSPIRVPLF